MTEARKRLTVRIPPSLARTIETLAKKHNLSVNEFIERILDRQTPHILDGEAK